MPFTLPSFNTTVNKDENKAKKIFQNNIQYNPIYNEIYNLEPKIVKKTDKLEKEMEKDIFDLQLVVILKNIADAVLLVIIDLADLSNYESIYKFVRIFIKENRLIYFGLFVIILSLVISLFNE